MGIDCVGMSRRQHLRNVLRQPCVQSIRGDTEADRIALSHRIHGQHAAARNGLLRDHHHVEQQLDAILRQKDARQIPDDLGLVVLEMPARHVLRIAQIDLRARRTGRSEGEPAELQPRRCRLGALADQVEGEFAILRLWIVIQHFEPIDDGAHGADEIVAHARTQQGRQFEGVGRGCDNGRRRGVGHKTFLETASGWFRHSHRQRRSNSHHFGGHDESSLIYGLIHCGGLCC